MKPKNFHENYVRDEVKAPSERSTGIVFAAMATILAILWRNSPVAPWIALTVAVLLAMASWLVPSALEPLNKAWFAFGLLLHRIVQPVVMFGVFVLVIVPSGLVMRMWRDPLKKSKTNTPSYWTERRQDGEASSSMVN